MLIWIRIRAVIIEDEPLAAQYLAALLDDTSQVEVVGSATESEAGLRLCAESPPDAVFVDINLPGKDGVSLATQLAMLPQSPRLVFTTGEANRATDAFRLEAVDYPYYHFADKKALLDAIAAEGFSSLKEEMLTRMEKETDPRARTQACGIAYVAFALQNPALFRLMFGGNDLPSADAALAGPRQLTYDVLQQVVAAHSPGGKADPLTCLGLWALVHGIAKLILEGGIQPSEYGSRMGSRWPCACSASVWNRPEYACSQL